MKNLEHRVIRSRCEVRARSESDAVIAGYAAVFNSRSQNLGGFVEIIDPAAFTKTLQEADVRALVNHDPNLVIARSSAGSLELEADGTGLRYDAKVNLADPDGRAAVEKIASGLIDGSSFGFRVIEDEWGLTDDGFPLRTLKQVELRDVGPATFPAYLDTSVAKRALEGLAERRGVELEKLVTEPAELRALIERTDEPETSEEQEPGQTPTSLRRMRLELMGRRHHPGPGNPHPDRDNDETKEDSK